MTGQDFVGEWCKRDHARAILPADRDVVESTRAVRELVVASVVGRAPDKDLFTACAVLGRIMAERGASPTLAVSTIDSAREALGVIDAEWVVPARAAVAEGYAAARIEMARVDAAKAWDYPRCAVDIGDGAIAIAAGFPDADLDALEQWASRVAHDASLAGVRRAIVAGGERARDALIAALTLAGIKTETSPPPRSARFFRLFRR